MNISYSDRSVGFVLGIAVVLLLGISILSGAVVAHPDDDGGHHHNDSHHHDGWMGPGGGAGGGFGAWWMFIWMATLLGVSVAAGYLLLSRRDSEGRETGEALELLRRRYAQGEIDEEEFETRRRKLVDD